MKLGTVADGRVYATDGRRVLVEPASGEPFERRGSLPDSPAGARSLRDRLATGPYLKSAVAAVVGSFPTENIWHVTDDDLLATVGRHLFSSHDGGWTWTHRRTLPPSSGTMGVLPSAVCVADDRVLLGEYPLDGTAPRVLVSADRGRTWTPHLELPDTRHVHAIQRDPYTGDVWVTTGDRDRECRIGRLVDGDVHPVGGGSQAWRAVELAFAPDAVLWGVDSALLARNRVFRLPRTALGTGDPEPEAVHDVPESIYYAAAWTDGDERRVAFSTAVGTRPDRTARDRNDGAAGLAGADAAARVVASSSASGFRSWRTVAAYRKRRRPVDRLPGRWSPSANAYVFLAADDDRGLVYNPYNTATDAGRLVTSSAAAETDRTPRRTP